MLGLRSLLHHHSSFQINVRITNNAKKRKEYIIRKSNPSNFCQMSCMNFGNLFYSKLSTKWIIPLQRIILCSERACSLVVAAARAAPEVLGSTSVGSELFQDLTALGLSVVGDVSVDSEAPVVTSSISRICRLSTRRCS